jgi:uncharacterized protein (TIGR02588 family)
MSRSGKPSARDEKNALEWAVFWAGLALLLAVAGALLHDAVTGGDGPPEITVSLGPPEPTRGGFRVPVEIRNDGAETAVAPQIEVVLHGPGSAVREQATLELDYLPRHSQREGAVTLRSDPRRGRIEAHVLGYQLP